MKFLQVLKRLHQFKNPEFSFRVFNHRSTLANFLQLFTVSYLQRLGELDKVPLNSLAGVDLGAQTDHLAAQLQTLLMHGRLAAIEKTVK